MTKPVYLYIKIHNNTGLMYFGRTVNPNPEKYSGSGVYWRNHLKKYGKNISTILFEKFDSLEDAKEFAIFFSEEYDIVNSNKWANMIVETAEQKSNMTGYTHTKESLLKMSMANLGENHWNYGKTRPDEVKEKIKKSNIGVKRSDSTKQKVSESMKEQYKNGKVSPLKDLNKQGENNPFYGKHHSEETKLKISLAKLGKGKPQEIIKCPHCGKIGGKSALRRWHFDNCNKYIEYNVEKI